MSSNLNQNSSNNSLINSNLWTAIIKLSWPAMIAMVFQSFSSITDVYFLGKIGSANAQAAIGIFSVLLMYLGSFNIIVGNGSISIIAQCCGASLYREAGKATVQTILLKLIGTFIMILPCIIFLKQLLILFGANGLALSLGIKYGLIILLALPFINAGYTFNTSLRAAGDALTPMYLMIFTLIFNIFLNYFFIFGLLKYLKLGIIGVSLATLISQLLLFILGLKIYTSNTKLIKTDIRDFLKPDLRYMYKIIKIGLPSGFQGILVSIASTVIIRYIAFSGMDAVAAYTVATRTAGIAIMPISGLSFATSAIVGQNIGANKPERAESTTNIAIWIALIVTCIFFIIFTIFPGFFLRFFTSQKDVISYGKVILPIFAFLQILSALISIYNAPMLGTGYLKPSFYVSLISTWIIQIPLLIILNRYFKLNGVWISFVIANLVNLYLIYRVYKKRQWFIKLV